MDDLEEGTGEGCSDWLYTEAVCSDGSSDEDESNNGSFESFTDLIDDSFQQQGNARALFNIQQKEETRRQVQILKRKFVGSPESSQATADLEISPRLGAISISPRKAGNGKRRLFISQQDSGVDSQRHETPGSIEDVDQVDNASVLAVSERGHIDNLNILRSSNRLACMLGVFKDIYGVGYKELTREYKSNKTCNNDWVVMAFGIREQVLDAAEAALNEICDYIFIQHRPSNRTTCTLMLLRFKRGKCRDTVTKTICGMLHCDPLACMFDPPKVQSVPAALYWYKCSLTPATRVRGELPDWVRKQTMLSCMSEDNKFDLSTMVQWAYDNDITEESVMAYEYAQRADEDANANAWLTSNSQAKHLRDCAIMVKHYKRAEMRKMSMSKWVWKCCEEVADDGDWKVISLFLRAQEVEVVRFLTAMRNWLKGVPKKNCIVISGPPNTGKSMFCMSLIGFLKGRVLSYANSKSHFWMQPLSETKVGLIDDATRSTWDYIDTYLRNALDGNPVSVDCKYRAPMQIKCPPLLITTNEDVMTNDRWKYLHSRMVTFYFKHSMPLDSTGTPQYNFTDSHWKSFFKRLQRPLDLSEDEGEEDNGEPNQPFKCSARGVDVHI